MARCTARRTGGRSTAHVGEPEAIEVNELDDDREVRLDVESLLAMEHGGEGEGEGGGELVSANEALGIGPNRAFCSLVK